MRLRSRQAFRAANSSRPASASVGVRRIRRPLVPELLSAVHLSVSHDALIAYVGACGGEPGVVVIAGTGSIAFGRGSDGREARAGGWGYVFGDEGGAFDIVRQALRAALRFEEGWGRCDESLGPAIAGDGGGECERVVASVLHPRVAAVARGSAFAGSG